MRHARSESGAVTSAVRTAESAFRCSRCRPLIGESASGSGGRFSSPRRCRSSSSSSLRSRSRSRPRSRSRSLSRSLSRPLASPRSLPPLVRRPSFSSSLRSSLTASGSQRSALSTDTLIVSAPTDTALPPPPRRPPFSLGCSTGSSDRRTFVQSPSAAAPSSPLPLPLPLSLPPLESFASLGGGVRSSLSGRRSVPSSMRFSLSPCLRSKSTPYRLSTTACSASGSSFSFLASSSRDLLSCAAASPLASGSRVRSSSAALGVAWS